MPRLRPLLTLTALLACTSTASDPGAPTPADTGGSSSTTGAPPPDTTGLPTTTTAEPPDTGAQDLSLGGQGSATTGSGTLEATVGGETTGARSECGDGEITPDEECDLGHEFNKNTAECNLNCELAKCGDGNVWEGVEECDAGPDNGYEYGGCTPQCEYGPRCGDGSVQGPEECDLGIKNGTGEKASLDSVPCSNTCRHVALLTFLSSVAYAVPQLGSSTGADARCQELAKSAGLNNAPNFKAWISDGWGSVNDRFAPAVEGMPYVLPGGLRVADDRAQLLASGPLVGITGTELGQTLLKAWVWTNTGPDGEEFDKDLDCLEWSKDTILLKARVGRSGVDKQDLAEWNA